MRVLVYSYNYHPEPIGIAPLMTELAEGLAARGHEVRVVTGMPNYPQRQIYPAYRGQLYTTETRNNVTIQRSYIWARPTPRLLDRILLDLSFVCTSFAQALLGPRPDVILMTAPPLPVVVPAVMISCIHNCPIVLNLQDILPDAAIQLGILKNKVLIHLFHQLEAFAYRKASTISVISPKFIGNLARKHVSPSKICCIQNWIDLSFICPEPSQGKAFRARHGLTNKFIALYSGNIAHSQGLETLLQAAAQLENEPDIAFLIVGESNAIQRLQAWCQAQKIAQVNIHFLPLQPREHLPALLSAADVGLVVQRRNVTDFNMPSKTQSLMASALPIVASVHEHSSAAEALRQSQGGLIVEPESPAALAAAIAHLHRHPKQVQHMGTRNRTYAETHYGFELALDRYEALFKKLLAPTAGEPTPPETTHPQLNTKAPDRRTTTTAAKNRIQAKDSAVEER